MRCYAKLHTTMAAFGFKAHDSTKRAAAGILPCRCSFGGDEGCETMKEAENILTAGGDAEMMSDSTLQKLIDYLKSVKGWTDAKIVELLEHITK